MSTTIYYPADKRGYANHGWLEARHSFSFAGYHDPQKIHFGVLRVLNDDIVQPGMGFGKHPHDNMEIITIALEGALEHKDSMGHTQVINPGEVQVMSAGTGVFHSEYNHNKDKTVNILQSWIFPNKRNVEPRYDQVMFAEEGRTNKLQTLVSPMDTDDAGLKIHQEAWIYRSKLDAGKSVTHNVHTGEHGVYIFVIEGSLKVGDQELGRRDAYGVSDISELTITANSDSDFLVYEVPMELHMQ